MQRGGLIIGVAVAGIMMVAIGYGMVSGGFVDGLKTVAGDPWGRVTLIDLGVGLLMAAAWIGWREQSIARAVPWWIAVVVTGNLAVGVYLIRAALRSRDVNELLLGGRA